jgi:hypothetical protein
VRISGKISINDDKAPSIIVDRLTEFEEDGKTETKAEVLPVAPEQAQSVKPVRKTEIKEEKADKDKTLWLNITGLEEADAEELLETLTFYGGETKVIFVKDGKKLACSQRVRPDRALMAELSYFLKEDCIKLL